MAATYPSYPNRTAHLLDGLWEFAWLGDVDPDTVRASDCIFDRRVSVPCCYDTLPQFAGKRGVAALRSRVYCPPGLEGWIYFKGMGLYAVILVDDQPIGTYQLPYSGVGFSVPVSEESGREIIIVLDNRFDATRTPLVDSSFDFYCYGGIYRSIEWHILPATAIRRAHIRTADLATGEIHVTVLLHHPCTHEEEVSVRCDKGEWGFVGTMAEGESAFAFTYPVPNPTPWHPDNPTLHLLEISVGVDSISERFGLRTIETKQGKLLLNGQPLKLRGVCRHEAHPDFGPALPDHLMIQDLERLRQLGCNFIRGAHYPQDPRFLDLCDEVGFMVFEESLGWGQGKKHFNNAKFCDLQEQQTVAMVDNSFNHPSVILWGFLNEADGSDPQSDSLFTRLAGAIRTLDPSRPVTYASKHPFDDRHFNLVDVISINTYPGWYDENHLITRPLDAIAGMLNKISQHLKEAKLTDKPVLITEIGAGAIYGWHDSHHARWSEEYQRDLLLTAVREMDDRDWINGFSLWQYCDCRTYDHSGALQRPRGFDNMGLCDEYHRPKLIWDELVRYFAAHPLPSVHALSAHPDIPESVDDESDHTEPTDSA